jgi:hypothetical protein
VDIGGALAAARSQAGLTITQVSQRTRIRETIIKGIERDDYSACGGDFYARGHIRAIARVVGTDPVPLIEEYDSARIPPPDLGPSGQNGADRHPADGSGSAGTPMAGSGRTSGITAAEAFRPAMPLQIRGGGRRPRRRGGLALILLAVIGTLTYLLVSGSSHGASSAPSSSRHGSPTGHHSAGAAPHRSISPSTAPTTVQLVPVSAAAFGPAGTSQGDNPQLAGLAIDGSASTFWQTDWYSTANFSGLQSGTGLLLDLGKPVTVTGARILLGSGSGGALELRAGNTPTLASLQPVAQASDTGGTLAIHVSTPVAARYLLIWFTSLPPNGTGTYQANIYNVSLTGTP